VKISKVLVTALSAGTLFAQVPADQLDARIQLFGEVIRPTAFSIAGGVKDQADRSFGAGIRFMGEMGSARNVYYELGGKLDSTSNLTFNGMVNGVPADNTDIKITSSYWFLGVGYLMPLGSAMSLGFHLEGRGEALAASGTQILNGTLNTVDAGTTYLRPWFRLSFDGTFSAGKFRPFIGADVSATPIKTTQGAITALSAMDDRTLRSMAPQVSAGLYAGLHF